MSRVWVVSGITVAATALAIAGFGSWLGGNLNCDAADLGRSLVAAGIGLALIGAALTLAGWLRLRHQESIEGDSGEGGARSSKRAGVTLVFLIIIGAFLVGSVSAYSRPPVDVYAKVTPDATTPPLVLLPTEITGHPRTAFSNRTYDNISEAVAAYEGTVVLRVSRFNETNAASANDTARAARYLDSLLSDPQGRTSSTACSKSPKTHWTAQTGGGTSLFAWRKGVWVFEVYGPTEAVRNTVAAALPY